MPLNEQNLVKPSAAEIVWPGLAAGLFWGLLTLGAQWAIGPEHLEGSWLELILSFGAGGALMGALAAGIAAISGMSLRLRPYRSSLQSVLLIWTVSVLGGAIASRISPDRYHLNFPELLAGGLKAVLLGALLGWIFSRHKENSGASAGLD